MKKRVLALLAVLVLLVGILPTAAWAEDSACTHENKAWKITDFSDMHYQYCIDCGVQLTEAEDHTLDAGGTLCTVCGRAPCDHFERLESNSLHHYSLCKYCSKRLSDYELHTFDTELGACTVCGERYDGCTHKNVAWLGDNENHVVYCYDCYTSGSSHTAHFENDVCTVCGLARCTHENATWKNSADYHCFYCPDCYTELVEYAEHSREETGCPNCGSNYCTHEDYTWENAYDGWGYGPVHYKVCNGCGFELFDLTYKEPHVDEDGNGACDECGTTCFHENVEFTEYGDHCEIWCQDCGEYVGGGLHWYATCDTCSLKGPCGPACTYEEGSNVCTKCGRTNDYAYTWDYNEKNHWKVCDDCGLAIDLTVGSGGTRLEPHKDADGVGGCDTCNYGCTHETELKNVKAATCTAKGYSGDEVCKHCGETVKTGEETPVAAHETELKNVKAATCTAKGYTGDEVCKLCQATVKAGSETAMIAHDYQDGACTVCQAKDPLSVKVEPAAGAPAVSAEIPTQDLLTEEDKAAMEQGTPVEIQLTVENADDTVAPEDKAEIEKAVEQINADNQPAEEGAAVPETKIGMYLDINLTKTVGDKQTAITETGSAVSISVEIPEGLLNTQEDTEREFFVLRLHEGKVAVLEDQDDDPNTVTIETDCFSVYVLAYTDRTVVESDAPVVDPDVPATGDESKFMLYGGLMIVSLLGVAYLALATKKRYC